MDQDEEPWVMYEAGPKSVLCPLICLPPACGTADCFFYVVMKLAEKGYRVISVSVLQSWDINLSLIHGATLRILVELAYSVLTCIVCLLKKLVRLGCITQGSLAEITNQRFSLKYHIVCFLCML